jgi:hypothetical protein
VQKSYSGWFAAIFRRCDLRHPLLYSDGMKRTQKSGRRRAGKYQLPGLKEYKPARQFLATLRDDRLPAIRQWESLLVDEVLQRFPTRTEQAQALGLTREGYRKKLNRMGLG